MAFDIDVKPARGKNQKRVLQALIDNGAMCNRQIANTIDYEINSVTPRVLELRELGLVEEAFKAKDPKTNRTVIYWRVA